MKLNSSLRSGTAAVAAIGIGLTLTFAGGAFASSRGNDHPQGNQGDQGNSNGNGNGYGHRGHYVGANWSIIDRNVIGNGDSYLRTGPSSAGGVTPPSGIGSLGLRTGSSMDAANFGNQVDFAGQPLNQYTTVSYYEFVTGEDLQTYAANEPNVKFEVFTQGTSGYSSLVFDPPASDAKADQWTQVDASTFPGWYYTRLPKDVLCGQDKPCTLQQAEAAAPNATIIAVEFGKGRDYAFSGAVDDLQLNDQLYDFEPFGVFQSTVH